MGKARLLLNIETIRRLTGWSAVEGQMETEYGGLEFFCFRLWPEKSDLPPVRILCSKNKIGVQEVRFGSGSQPRYFQGHYSSGWWSAVAAIGFARRLVRGGVCLLKIHDPDGGPVESRYLRAEEWPTTIFTGYCRKAGDGEAELRDVDGQGWKGPRFTRTFFNRGEMDAVPDWSAYVPTRLGWMTLEKRNLARQLEESLGLPKHKRLT